MPSTKRAKVFFDASSLRYLHTGLGQFEFNLLKEFTAIGHSDLEITALVHPDYSERVPGEITVIPTNWMRRHSPAFLQKFLYPSCKVWHITDENTRLAGIPSSAQVVLTIHGLHFLDEEAHDPAARKLRKVQRLADRANAITVVSEHTGKLIASKLDVAGKEIKVIPNGVSLKAGVPLLASPSQSLRRSEAGRQGARPSWAPQGKFIYAVGTFFRRKNFHVLVPMMKHLPEFTLVLAGDDTHDYGHYIKKEIGEAGLSERILMPGEISEEEKIWLYQHGEAMMFPSVSEGFGIPVIECLTFGKLVICSRYGSLPEVGGDHAAYWDNFDPASMAQIVRQKISAEDPSKGPSRMAYASGFTWKKSATEFLELYRSLAAKPHA